MKILSLIIISSLCIALPSFGEEKAEGHVIPKDSKVEHDYRVLPNPFMMDRVTAGKLTDCKTYEELRDSLKLVIPELLKSGR